ncbi:UDP-glucose:glycoprotein glucosyltransferase [Halotydeus destructor]|nr:UDP-glucose:glycoprotein glucosyltransferase [Halotydeus destructor]
MAINVYLWYIVAVLTASAVLADDATNSQAESTDSKTSKSIAITLSASWKETPLYLETSEYIAEDDSDLFWAYINLLYSKFGADKINFLTPAKQYEASLDVAREIFDSPTKLSLLKFALAIRAHSPAIAMFNQIAADKLQQYGGDCMDSPLFIEVSIPAGKESPILCTFDELESYIANIEASSSLAHPLLYSTDHILNTTEHSPATVILYGEIGSETFLNFHNVLKTAVADGKVKYVVRHYNKNKPNKKVSLSAYGVELAIKSTEYKAIDDQRVKGEATSFTQTLKEAENSNPDEIEGFLISSLKSLHPEKVEKLDEFAQHLLDNKKEIATLKKWELQELSLQTASKILSLPQEEQLKVFKDIVQSFPVHAPSLTRIKVSPELKKESEKNQYYFLRTLNLSPTDTALFINGMFFDAESVDIFTLLYYIKNEINLVAGGGDDKKLNAKLKKQRHHIKSYGSDHSVIKLPPSDPDAPSLDLIAIVEPLSRGAQKLIPILMTLQKVTNVKITIYLNCVEKHSEMPLKTFFRFVLDSEPNFPENEPNAGPAYRALFSSMPVSPLYTLAMVTPENWLVEAVRSPYDLDNIHLEQVDGNGVWGDFELAHLLLEGQCFEQSSGFPPRGLQFVLGTNSTPVTGDTIVMANLGYFQLKANPGAWILRIRPGKSSEIYTIANHEGTEVATKNAPYIDAVINSFRSSVIIVEVNKKPGKKSEDLLGSSDDDDEDDNGLWSSLSTWAKSGNEESASEQEKLNIFSVASGHLYERLLRIMMLSVLKHTKLPVKFWFLKNYLSPTFKQFLPEMKKSYDFEYELVEYKWPRWLNQQTEKQRIIWGYKILFLDVLFPLDVKKIIFVDADQVVRTDLKELLDLDLEGAPYGYTPFCDSRKEMDGFRFWKTGYWANHLYGRRYHISALYVVDLKRFRQVAAGDRLRGQYQGLSQDPNSLSNLDQDLPNNMIHQVPIKSLPQEWLWCETWCSDDSKPTAKTIDLCNNPQTKEPKLTAARRILPEWEGYDNEIKELMDSFMSKRREEEEAAIDVAAQEERLSEKIDPTPETPETQGTAEPEDLEADFSQGTKEQLDQGEAYIPPLTTETSHEKTEL